MTDAPDDMLVTGTPGNAAARRARHDDHRLCAALCGLSGKLWH